MNKRFQLRLMKPSLFARYTTNPVKPQLIWKDREDGFDAIAKFNIMSFNLLAPCYKRLHTVNTVTGSRLTESVNLKLWQDRANTTLNFFNSQILKSTEIVALQEYWLEADYAKIFHNCFTENGYKMCLLQRTGVKVDAVALMVKDDMFEIIDSENIFLCALADRVALIVWLRHRVSGKNILVATTHLSFPHSTFERYNQLQQMQNLTSTLDLFATKHQITHATRIVLGDFNVESDSPVCDHLREAGYMNCFEILPPQNGPEDNFHKHAKAKEQFIRAHSLNRKLHHASPVHWQNLVKDKAHRFNKEHHPAAAAGSSANTTAASAAAERKQHYPRFVSHRTHNNEELGVDHIFVMPECNHFQQYTHHAHEYPSLHPHSTAHLAASSDFIHTDIHETVPDGVFVDQCKVLPVKMPCDRWYEDFNISDHRPVCCTIVIGRPKHPSTDDFCVS